MLGRFDSQVDVLGHSQSSLPGLLGQLPIRHRLQTPSDTVGKLPYWSASRPPALLGVKRMAPKRTERRRSPTSIAAARRRKGGATRGATRSGAEDSDRGQAGKPRASKITHPEPS